MSCGELPSSVQKRLIATSGNDATEWFLGWIPCTGLGKVKATIKTKGGTANFRTGQLAVQFAEVRTDNPGGVVTYGTLDMTGNNERCTGEVDLFGNTSVNLFVRFGVVYDSSDGNFAQGDVELQVSYTSCGRSLGSWVGELVAVSTTNQFAAVTAWVPAMYLTKVKAAFVVSGRSGNFRCRLTYRTATTSRESPGSWQADDQAFDTDWKDADEEDNTGELTITGANEMWVQIGIMYNLSSGTTPGQATVAVHVAERR